MNTIEEAISENVSESTGEMMLPAEKLVMQQANALVDASQTEETDTDPDKSLEMIRTILFGEQAKATEKRQASLERYIRVSVDALNEETQKRVEILKSEISLLTDLLEEEVQSRKTGVQDHQQRFDIIERSLDKLGHQILDNRSELSQRIDQEKQQLNQQMEDWRQEMTQQFEMATRRLNNEKTDRHTMALLLTEMAEKLSADE